MTVDCEYHDYGHGEGTWSTGDVSAFIEGPWLDELNSIYREVSVAQTERASGKQKADEREKIEKLKKDFGI